MVCVHLEYEYAMHISFKLNANNNSGSNSELKINMQNSLKAFPNGAIKVIFFSLFISKEKTELTELETLAISTVPII